ncbi:hypothetical protein Vretimale_13224 [Volvox reticuliferus]|uniref:Pherophorin domain-containing protein n=1 Tax=Volvox reticuliferus TaxID=1737510 RepID=A0A8J4LU09_9CHLO|nr:hypothetical protein Vretifemale_14134 [Volvox reticuliferus]GIM09312.1 hypothetical protein Vretimale_13224 [Volvox reticuliferus]
MTCRPMLNKISTSAATMPALLLVVAMLVSLSSMGVEGAVSVQASAGGNVTSYSLKIDVTPGWVVPRVLASAGADANGEASSSAGDSSLLSLAALAAANVPSDLASAADFTEEDAKLLSQMPDAEKEFAKLDTELRAESVFMAESNRCFDVDLWVFRLTGCFDLSARAVSVKAFVKIPFLGTKSMGSCTVSLTSGPGCVLGFPRYAAIRLFFRGRSFMLEATFMGKSRSFTVFNF